MARNNKIKTCKFCGTEIDHYGDFCTHWCKEDWQEAKADHDYHVRKDQELDEQFRNF